MKEQYLKNYTKREKYAAKLQNGLAQRDSDNIYMSENNVFKNINFNFTISSNMNILIFYVVYQSFKKFKRLFQKYFL